MEDIGKLHEKNILHSDICPDNIMLMPDGSLKLLDFGSARVMEDGKAMTVLAKKGFAPVEQYQRHDLGAFTDVYALAAAVYYCLTGVYPTAAPGRLLDDVPLKSPIALGVAFTPDDELVLLWGLTVRPEKRPANMTAFKNSLFLPESQFRTLRLTDSTDSLFPQLN